MVARNGNLRVLRMPGRLSMNSANELHFGDGVDKNRLQSPHQREGSRKDPRGRSRHRFGGALKEDPS